MPNQQCTRHVIDRIIDWLKAIKSYLKLFEPKGTRVKSKGADSANILDEQLWFFPRRMKKYLRKYIMRMIDFLLWVTLPMCIPGNRISRATRSDDKGNKKNPEYWSFTE